LPRENRAPTRSGTASAFWRWRRRRLLASGANASLDDIAKEAGVGAGTLYRHFPTRDDALIEAVYRTEVEKLAAAEKKFSESLPPIEALRAWMLLFVDYIATSRSSVPL
jgi:AcrR family transcriptional regulator